LVGTPTVLWSSSPTFDPSFVELGLALANCSNSEQSESNYIGQLVIIPTAIRRTPHLLAKVIANTRVTLLMMTPSLLMSLDSVFIEQILQGSHKNITDIVLGGEAFPTTWLATHSGYLDDNNNNRNNNDGSYALLQIASKRRKQHKYVSVSESKHISPLYPRLWNIYGTTECSIWATLHQVDLTADVVDGTPLGIPLAGITLSIRKSEDIHSTEGYTIGELVITVDDSRYCRINDETEPI
jgi:hypothetical protein